MVRVSRWRPTSRIRRGSRDAAAFANQLGGRLFLPRARHRRRHPEAFVVIAIFYTEQVSIADLALSMASLGLM